MWDWNTGPERVQQGWRELQGFWRWQVDGWLCPMRDGTPRGKRLRGRKGETIGCQHSTNFISTERLWVHMQFHLARSPSAHFLSLLSVLQQHLRAPPSILCFISDNTRHSSQTRNHLGGFRIDFRVHQLPPDPGPAFLVLPPSWK